MRENTAEFLLQYLVKAERAAASAKLLLEAGDLEGACNRAYYAMFDGARAALMATGAPAEAQTAKTHNGLIAAFSRCLVKTGRISVTLFPHSYSNLQRCVR